MKNIYKTYHSKGFEIIGISRDEKTSQWKKAIFEDSTQNWTHILVQDNDQKIDGSVSDKYFVYGIPVKILINKEGIIIGRWIGGGEENTTALNDLLFKAFKAR